MSLLALEGVSKRYGRGAQARTALRNVSLEVSPGELVAVWGRQRFGRSTLMRVAAGLERPDSGTVKYNGKDLAGHDADEQRACIRYVRKSFQRGGGRFVLDQLLTSQLAHGVPSAQAESRAHKALARTAAERCAAMAPNVLDSAEALRVALARSLVHEPRLLVIDDPMFGIDLLEREGILTLLRSIANEGIAIFISASETTCLAGSDRALTLDNGELRGALKSTELAPVLPLRPAAAGESARA
jgi:ABC-type multidrug transport system ATPase subunit